MSNKIKLERQKMFCKYCGKEMTVENECNFHLLPYNDSKAEVCCKDCIFNVDAVLFLILEARSLRLHFGFEGINGIDYPYQAPKGLTEEEFDALEFEHEERIIEYATRDRSYMEGWGDDDAT